VRSSQATPARRRGQPCAAALRSAADPLMSDQDRVQSSGATSDDAQCLVMLVRRKGETLDALLLRLDAAIADAYDNDRFIDEVNASTASGSRRPQR
jgi:hypothetical protein